MKSKNANLQQWLIDINDLRTICVELTQSDASPVNSKPGDANGTKSTLDQDALGLEFIAWKMSGPPGDIADFNQY